MVYTEIKQRNANRYFYRVLSIREKNKVLKKRIYLGVNLSKLEQEKKEIESDKKIYELKRIRKNKEFEDIKKEIIKILKKNKIKKAGIFGSYARGEQRKYSDIDIIIEPHQDILGFAFFGLQDNLSKKINKKVDLITYKSINPLIRERILNQEVRII